MRVLELIPPYVQTGLMGARRAADPTAMPLAEFIAEVMGILETSPEAEEICVERVNRLRFAEAGGGFSAFFKQFNNLMTAARQQGSAAVMVGNRSCRPSPAGA